ncbi:hypothetical protein, partial [Alicyclobacillus pomorum]|uniref:hypothetical protein n=1 Tax=Alicyclobacillus pomorum TaxID=204470 RepID=UPI0039EE8EE8
LGDPPEIVSGMVAVDFRNADVTRFVASFFITAAAATSNNISRFERRINRKYFLFPYAHSTTSISGEQRPESSSRGSVRSISLAPHSTHRSRHT